MSWTFSPKYEDIGSQIAKGWRAETAPMGEAHRATSNDVLATVHSSTKATSDCGECMGEGRLSQRALRMQAIWSWSLGESKSFREVTVAWSCRGIWTYVAYVRDAIHWFLHKFNVDLVDTVQALKAAARLMCPATAPLLHPTPASFHLPQQLRAFPFLIGYSHDRQIHVCQLVPMVIWSWTSNVANCGQNVPVGWTPTDTIGPRSRSR